MRVTLLLIAFLLIYQLFLRSTFAVSIELSNPVPDGDGTTLDVSVSGLAQTSCPNTKCFLQGMYTKTSTNKYFGFTQSNDNNWYLYDGTPDPQVIREVFFNFTPLEGSWSGKIKVKPDFNDSDYSGPGSYVIRVRRYTGNTDGPTSERSNDLAVTLNFQSATPTTTQAPSPEPTVTVTTTPTGSSSSRSSSASISPSATVTAKLTPTISETAASTSSSIITFAGLEVDPPSSSRGAVLAKETDALAASPPAEINNNKSNKKIPLILAGLSLFSVSSLLLIMRYLKLIR